MARRILVVDDDSHIRDVICFALEKAVASYAAKFGFGEIPRPPHWTGFRIMPVYIEFWRDGAFRLHDRVVFRRSGADQPWSRTRLYP